MAGRIAFWCRAMHSRMVFVENAILIHYLLGVPFVSELAVYLGKLALRGADFCELCYVVLVERNCNVQQKACRVETMIKRHVNELTAHTAPPTKLKPRTPYAPLPRWFSSVRVKRSRVLAPKSIL